MWTMNHESFSEVSKAYNNMPIPNPIGNGSE